MIVYYFYLKMNFVYHIYFLTFALSDFHMKVVLLEHKEVRRNLCVSGRVELGGHLKKRLSINGNRRYADFKENG